MSVTVIESALVARLVAQLKVPGLVREVYAQVDYERVTEQAMVTPSVAVIYSGYYLGDKVGTAGVIREVGFNWLVVVNVRNARSTATGQGVRDEASPIFDAVLEALLGFRPSPKHKPLQLEPAPGAALNDAGFGYYPLAFSTLATYRGNP